MMRKSVLIFAALLMLTACGGGKSQTESTDAAVNDSVVQQGLVDDSTEVKAKEAIVGLIHELYAAAAQNESDIDGRFACQAWRDTVAAVDKKDADVAEIGFFNDDYWTMMQDSNPDDLEARDIRFEQFDAGKGRALVGFTLHSSVQTVRMKFAFCRDDGDWRVHDIIRFYDDPDGQDSSFSFMESMQSYLNEPTEE